MTLGVGSDESIDTSIEKPTAAAGTLFNCDFLNLNEWMMFLFFWVTLILSQFDIYQIEIVFTLPYQCSFGDILYYMSDT